MGKLNILILVLIFCLYFGIMYWAYNYDPPLHRFELKTTDPKQLQLDGRESSHKQVLRLYMLDKYLGQGVKRDFEVFTRSEIQIVTFNSDYELAQAIQNTQNDCDLVILSAYNAERASQAELLYPLDQAMIPNLSNIDRELVNNVYADANIYFAVPYTRVLTGIGFNKIRNPDPEPTWRLFGHEEFYGRTALLDNLREVIGIALFAAGYSLNDSSDDALEAAEDMLMRWRSINPYIPKNIKHMPQLLINDDYDIVHIYNGDCAQVMLENPDISFLIPYEGSVISYDMFVIPVNAANWILAHKFINYMLDPNVAANNMKEIAYYMPNPKALSLLPNELLENEAFAVSEENLEKSEVLHTLSAAEQQRQIEIWHNFEPR